jgi:hypothetical protein
MTETQKTRQRRTTNGLEPPFAAFLEGNQDTYMRWLDGMFEISQEIAQFTQNRLQEDMAAWAALAACHDPKDTVDCQRRITETVAEQYAKEFGKLSHMMMTIMGESLSSFHERPGTTS